MLREYMRLDSPNSMSSADSVILDSIMFNRTWPDIIAQKTTAGDFTYTADIESFLCSVSNLPWETVNAVIQGLRRKEYNDILGEQVSLIFDSVDVADWDNFLEPAFIDKVEKQIISNERSRRAKSIAKIAYTLVARMINDNGNGSMNHLRSLSMSQAKTVIVYILVANTVLHATMMGCKLGLAA